MAKLSKSHVEKNILVPASISLGIFLGYCTNDVQMVAWCLLIGFVITTFWCVYYAVRIGFEAWSEEND